MNNYQPDCPKCGATLIIDDGIDFCGEFDKMTEFVLGHCPQCKTDYQWDIRYAAVGTENLKES